MNSARSGSKEIRDTHSLNLCGAYPRDDFFSDDQPDGVVKEFESGAYVWYQIIVSRS